MLSHHGWSVIKSCFLTHGPAQSFESICAFREREVRNSRGRMPSPCVQMSTALEPQRAKQIGGPQGWLHSKKELEFLTWKKQGWNVCEHLHFLSYQSSWTPLGVFSTLGNRELKQPLVSQSLFLSQTDTKQAVIAISCHCVSPAWSRGTGSRSL